MKGYKLLSAGTAALVFFLPLPGQAFECTKYLAEAESAIQTVTERFETKPIAARVALSDLKTSEARKLLANAMITLLAARVLHENSQGPLDHARALAKAYAAKGFALATDHLLALR